MNRLTPVLFHMVERSNEFQKEKEVELVKLNFFILATRIQGRELQVRRGTQQKCKSFGDNNNI